MRTLLCSAADAPFARFQHRGPGYSAFFPNHRRHMLFSNQKVSVVMTSVRLNARINERYRSGRTLE